MGLLPVEASGPEQRPRTWGPAEQTTGEQGTPRPEAGYEETASTRQDTGNPRKEKHAAGRRELRLRGATVSTARRCGQTS